MKKFIPLIIGLSIFLNSPLSFANTTFFSDVPPTHKNYNAINYLKQNGIINGYEDNTFRPTNLVTRAEFLKIIIEGSNIENNGTAPLIFTDIDQTAWYIPYLRKAYDEEWIKGYADNTFRPNKTITKAEALKITAKAQNWGTESLISTRAFKDVTPTIWYGPYTSFAKEHNYLEETGDYFYPEREMTRAGISELIYRTIQNPAENPADPTEEPEQEQEEVTEESEPTSSNNSTNTIDQDFFENITLNSPLPKEYYKNEIYIIEGSVSSNTYEEINIVLDSGNSSQNFKTTVTNKYFSTPIFFSDAGSFNIGIIPGEAGKSKAKEIKVLSQIPQAEGTATKPKVENLDIQFQNGKTEISTELSKQGFKKITFSQNSKTHTYYSRQDLEDIAISYADFRYFQEKDTKLKVEAASMSSIIPLKLNSDFGFSKTIEFTAISHQFSEIVQDEIETSPPETLSSSSKNIDFSGEAKTTLKRTAYVIKPNGFVETITLEGSGKNFEFIYNPSENGTYIVEINNDQSLPIINHPIYIGKIIPLIPDYFDLHERKLFSGSIDENAMTNEMLNYINEARAEHELSPITNNTELNLLAKNHSIDMAENNFFSHTNKDGQSPDDRRILAQIPMAVSENIAKDTSIKFAHEGLMRSASHRKNILTAEWTQVGIGIAEKDGYLYITQEFSADTVSEESLVDYKTELLSEINTLRSNNGKSPLNNTSNLDNSGEYLNNKAINEGLELNSTIFTEALSTYSITGSSVAIGRNYNIWSSILSSILTDEEDQLTSDWINIGIDLALDAQGTIHSMIILNK
ncbi:S-layer homology domain-containing protein [Patescibacteria group bacterium]|nr:S-layer homology domain-containing protein [Patescibacteria group bacterium]